MSDKNNSKDIVLKEVTEQRLDIVEYMKAGKKALDQELLRQLNRNKEDMRDDKIHESQEVTAKEMRDAMQDKLDWDERS